MNHKAFFQDGGGWGGIMYINCKAGADTGGGGGGSGPTPFGGPPNFILHKEGKNVTRMCTDDPRFSTLQLQGPPPPFPKSCIHPCKMPIVQT